MLRPRIIPCLLIHDGGLVKTQQFKVPKYVGDPLNAVKIFNEKAVDELIVLDIDATVRDRPPDLELIRKLAYECRMPFCYGGGVKTVPQAREIIRAGAEKVAISSAAIDNPSFLRDLGEIVGRQSVVVVLDIRENRTFFGSTTYTVCTRNGTVTTGETLEKNIEKLNEIGVGEIVVNSIDRDGMMVGYDLELAEFVRHRTDVPLTILGGAGSLDHIAALTARFGTIGAAAGSLFVFKGKYRAVLINYPNREEKRKLTHYNQTQ